jgi:RHS repeat-associated protein
MCNSSGTIVARYSYDPYGRTTLVSGSNLATFQFTGDYAHLTSGLNLTKYRAYDPNTGRWLSRDPLKNAETSQGPNLYEYVGNNPVKWTDPEGLQAVPLPYAPPVAPPLWVYDAGLVIVNGVVIVVAIDVAANCPKKVTCKIVSISPQNEHGLARIDVQCTDGSSYFFLTGDPRPYRVGQSVPPKK